MPDGVLDVRPAHRGAMINFDMHAIGRCVNGHYTDFINIATDVRCSIHLSLQCCRVVMASAAAAAAVMEVDKWSLPSGGPAASYGRCVGAV